MINGNRADEDKEQEDPLQRPRDGTEPGTFEKQESALCDWGEGKGRHGLEQVGEEAATILCRAWQATSKNLDFILKLGFYCQGNEKSWRVSRHQQICTVLKRTIRDGQIDNDKEIQLMVEAEFR